ncbi:hypothetical protein PIB30_027666 [Stylosanthes scabra]|uniref:Uncharacterized protein n=1 Tax=Stylosanthes scabra TaxID=79078 RepID=A0ABU6SBA4_9FABA|nr:hypothetical protein [Stylosanthes scabra]
MLFILTRVVGSKEGVGFDSYSYSHIHLAKACALWIQLIQVIRGGKAGSPLRFGRPRQSPPKNGTRWDGLKKLCGFKILARPALWRVSGPPAGRARRFGGAGLASFFSSAGSKS